jgi:hypothetical protein
MELAVIGVPGSVRAAAQERREVQRRDRSTNKEDHMKDETAKTRLPLALELAEPKHIAGEVEIQLSSRTNTRASSTTVAGRSVLSDIAVDVSVDDVIA